MPGGGGKAIPVKKYSEGGLRGEIVFLVGVIVFFIWKPGSLMLEVFCDIFQKQSVSVSILTGVIFSLAFVMFVFVPLSGIIQRVIELARRRAARRGTSAVK